jgi:hypothetical protein
MNQHQNNNISLEDSQQMEEKNKPITKESTPFVSFDGVCFDLALNTHNEILQSRRKPSFIHNIWKRDKLIELLRDQNLSTTR